MRKFLLIVFVIAANAACLSSPGARDVWQSNVRPPAVAGQFYPASPEKLRQAILSFIKDAVPARAEKPVAIVVPHAGYIFSGQIIADAYRQAMGRKYEVVVIPGTNHTAQNFSRISVYSGSAFRTPLGDAQVDKPVAAALLAKDKDCTADDGPHRREHSVEVQVPFIQVLFPEAHIVPVVIGEPALSMCSRFGQTLAEVLKDRQALIVASSDLSHYPDYKDAAAVDRLTLETIAGLDTMRISSLMRNLNVPNLDTRACGEAAILVAVTAARALGATRAVIAGYANSGDIPVGDRSRTVGYGSVVLAHGSAPSNTAALNRPTPPSAASPLQFSEKKVLLAFARETITRYLTTQTVPLARSFPARMEFRQGVFVTLRKAGQLRGCIGHMAEDIELGKAVGAMALQSAFNDPRFPPVELSEVNSLEIEISVLTPLKSIPNFEQIVVGRDGVLMSKSGTSAVFLPQVAVENHWNRSQMLDNLCIKAGLQSGCWKRDAQFQVFQADVFGESQVK